MRKIYLDNAATTRVRPEVVGLMRRIMEEDYANPSSMHAFGVSAERYVREAGETIASLLGVSPSEIIFNSGGTEGANTAIIGTALRRRRYGRHIVSTAIEHPAVTEALRFLEGEGFEITSLGVDSLGRIEPDELRAAIRPDTILLSVMTVNNEIGTIADISSISRTAREVNPKIYIHTDAVQAFGKLELRPRAMGVDLLTASAHKIHGPKGVGFMYVNASAPIHPTVFGGGQQKGMRSGTLNVPGIAGISLAARMYADEREQIISRMKATRERLAGRLLELDDVSIVGGKCLAPWASECTETAVREQDTNFECFAPYILAATFGGVRAEVLLHALEQEGVYVSAGSACSTHKPRPSATLSAIGMDKESIESTLRFSLGIYNEPGDADYAADTIARLLPKLRRYTRR